MCEGLPVVSKFLAGILRSRNSFPECQEVLEIDIWRTSSNNDHLHSAGVTPLLMLSCYCLPNVLRQCLPYYAIFTKDHVLDVNKLTQTWTAQGYFHSQSNKMESKTVAARCFRELVNRSFFREFNKNYIGNLTCKLVGAVNDFIEFLTEKECLILHADGKTEFEENNNNNNSFTKARHCTLKVEPQTLFPAFIGKTSKLHTLMVLAEHSYTDPKTLSRRPRALDLSYCSVRELQIKAGSVRHLRYLDLSFNRDLKKLAKVICRLSFLQTLNLNGCDYLLKLPKGIGKLSSLRHLEILWTRSLSYLPKGIASLTSLPTLNRFFGNDCVHGKAYNFGDLKNLKHLRVCISIDGSGKGSLPQK